MTFSFFPVYAAGQTRDIMGNQDTNKTPKPRTDTKQEKKAASDTASAKHKSKWPDSLRKK